MNEKIDLTLMQALLKQKDAEILALKKAIEIGRNEFATMKILLNIYLNTLNEKANT